MKKYYAILLINATTNQFMVTRCFDTWQEAENKGQELADKSNGMLYFSHVESDERY